MKMECLSVRLSESAITFDPFDLGCPNLVHMTLTNKNSNFPKKKSSPYCPY
jgi:hypothetical protein